MDKKEKYLELTTIDLAILESYKHFIAGLGEYLGEGYEIILHSLEDLQHSVIKIYNGHYSGRKEGMPITDLALSMLAKMKDGHAPIHYLNKAKNGVVLRSTTIPIEGERGRTIGLVCINYYTDTPISAIIKKFQVTDSVHYSAQEEIRETFAENTDDLIKVSLETVQEEVQNDPDISAQNKNKEIIIRLQQKGIFNLKNAVIEVAERLGISKNTVYMHLRNNKES